jgi:hypothetical protein
VKEDPSRFARLLLKMPSGTSEAYVDAILRGLAGARIASDLLRDVCRHAQIIGGSRPALSSRVRCNARRIGDACFRDVATRGSEAKPGRSVDPVDSS